MAAEKTYLEFSDDKSHKFYEVTLDGIEVTVRYGRIGDAGTTSVKTEILHHSQEPSGGHCLLTH